MLASRITTPSASLSVIQMRHDMVDLFCQRPKAVESLRSVLAQHLRHDIARAIQNLRFNYGGPWHLGVVLETFWGLEELKRILKNEEIPLDAVDDIVVPSSLKGLLESVIPFRISKEGIRIVDELSYT